MIRLPIIRDVQGSGKPPTLKDLHRVFRTLPPPKRDTTQSCFVQFEDGSVWTDELTNLGIFDDLSWACRTQETPRSREPDLRDPFPPVTHTGGRRGQRQFFNPDTFPTTFDTCDEIIHEVIPPPPPPEPPAPPTGHVEYSDCRDKITFSWSSLDGFSGLKVEIGDTGYGPWTTYLVRNDTPSSLTFSNYFTGTKFVRISALAGATYIPFLIEQPLGPVVAPPVFGGVTNVTDVSGTLPTLVISPFDGTQVYPVSEDENPLIGLTGEGYVEVRKRMEYYNNQYDFSGNTFATFTHPDPGVTVRFTVDNTLPSLFNGQASGTNAAASLDSFGNILRAVAIKDGCTSPECVIVLDKRTNIYPQVTAYVWSNGGVSGSCDLPHNTNGSESAQSCNLIYGSKEAFAIYFQAISGCNHTFLNAVLSGGKGIWNQTVTQGAGPAVNGFAPWIVSVSNARFDYSDWNRPVGLDAYPADVVSILKIDGVPRVLSGQVTGVGGSSAPLIFGMDYLLGLRSPPCPAPNDGSDVYLTTELITTRIQ